MKSYNRDEYFFQRGRDTQINKIRIVVIAIMCLVIAAAVYLANS